MTVNAKTKLLTLALGAAILAALAYASALTTIGEYPFRLYDGDFVHPHLLVRDFAAGGSIFEWSNSAALYAFPDWLFALTALLPIESRAAIQVTSLLFLFAIIFAGGEVVRKYLGNASLWQGIILYVGALLVLTSFATWPMQWIIDYAASIYIHTGATLILLICLPLSAALLAGRDSLRNAVILSLLCAATTYSDPMFATWFLAPFIAVTILVAIKTRRLNLYALVVSAFIVFAFLAEHYKPFPSAPTSLFIASPWDTFVFLGRIIDESLSATSLLIFIYILTVLWAVVLFIGAAIRTLRAEALSERTILAMILAGSAIVVVLVPILAGAIDHASKFRYMIALVYLTPILLLMPLLHLLQARISQFIAYGSVAVVSVILALNVSAWLESFRSGQHDDLIACLDAHGLTDGYAHYAYAKPVIVLTDDRIHLAQAGGSAGINFSARLQNERIDGSPFRPNFIVTDQLDPGYLPPAVGHIQCPNHEIRLFTPGQVPPATL